MTAEPGTDHLALLRKRLRERPMRKDLAPVKQRAQRLINDAGDSTELPTIVQVVGSNGKGSVAHYLSGLLATADHDVVTYTSPHLQDVTERIQRNTGPIGTGELNDLLGSFEDTFLTDFTPFEALFLSALKLSLRENSDHLVLEAGMGGRWDATSALTPEWVILTSLDREHTDYLGSNLSDILDEKLAQLPPRGNLITGYLDDEASRNGLMTMIRNKNLTHVGIGDAPSADEHNRRLGLLMAGLLNDDDTQQLQNQLEAMKRPPGRQENRSLQERRILLDVAHTPRAIAALAETIRDRSNRSERYLLYGSLEGKETDRIVNQLGDLFRPDHVRLTTPGSDRALAPGQLQAKWPDSGDAGPSVTQSPFAAFESLLEQSAAGDLIVVAGSFHLVGAVRSEWIT